MKQQTIFLTKDDKTSLLILANGKPNSYYSTLAKLPFEQRQTYHVKKIYSIRGTQGLNINLEFEYEKEARIEYQRIIKELLIKGYRDSTPIFKKYDR